MNSLSLGSHRENSRLLFVRRSQGTSRPLQDEREGAAGRGERWVEGSDWSFLVCYPG